MKEGKRIVAQKRLYSAGINDKLLEVKDEWKRLEDQAAMRLGHLQEALDFFQFSAEMDDQLAWLQDAYRLVSSDDFGHDEFSTQSLLKKHYRVREEVDKHRKNVVALRKHATTLPMHYGEMEEVKERIQEVERVYGEVAEVAVMREQWLNDALAVYRMFSEVNACELWIDEKEKWLNNMEVPERLEDVEVVAHRFESLDQEMNSLMGRILDVNQIVQQLLDGGHPSSSEVRGCQDHLNSRWNRMVELVEQKKDHLDSILRIQNYLLESSEIKSQIQEKRKAIDATQYSGSDLGSVLALQRRLSTMEGALAVLEPKLIHLQQEAEELATSQPHKAEEILIPFDGVSVEWDELKRTLQGCEDSLTVAGRLQQFIQDLDSFLTWMVQKQTEAASSELPESLEEAEKLINLHAALNEEIQSYEEDYERLQSVRELLDGEETQLANAALHQWLQKLSAGWNKLLQMWESRRDELVQAHIYHLFMKDVKQAESFLNNQESSLAHVELPTTVETVEAAIKKHKEFSTAMELNLHRIEAVIEAGESLISQSNIYSERIRERVDLLITRGNQNRDLAQDWLRKLNHQWALQRFLQDCHELGDWVMEKMLTARDSVCNDLQQLHKKWLKHQAFMAELSQNKEWLDRIQKDGERLMEEKPELSEMVQQKLNEIRECWLELENSAQIKALQLFENDRAQQISQNYTRLNERVQELEVQLCHLDRGNDLTTVNKQLKKLQMMERQMEEWCKDVCHLQQQSVSLPDECLMLDAVSEQQTEVESRIVRLIEPLKERRRILLASKEVHQVRRDLQDEILWVQERIPLAMSQETGSTLQAVQQLMKKNQSLQRELEGHCGRVEEVMERATVFAAVRTSEAECISGLIEGLHNLWGELWAETERRQVQLDSMYHAQQYYSDITEVEAWLSEQELHMMNEEKGKDEASTLQLLKKHLALEQTIDDYAETIGLLSQQCRQLLEICHPDSEQISKRQSQIDRLYVSLKDLVDERKCRLEQQYWLFQLNREVDELEQWIAEREISASSTELGQDYEHVTILQENFSAFSSETGGVGQERVLAINQMVDELIDYGHADAAVIAEWKDGVNESWAELMELMETRAQMLAASHQLHKFFSDCREVMTQVEDKYRRLPEVRDQKDGTTNTSSLQRLMSTFEHDIQLLVNQVRQLQESAAQLRTIYAGERADAIAMQEHEVMQAWKELLICCEECRLQITTATDKLRFFGLVRDQLMWMDSIICQIGMGEKPRDVSSVEVLMNYHQSLKNEVEARNTSMVQCIEMGRTLLASRNPASEEIQEKLERVLSKQKELMEKWDKHWEELQHMLEVHQFAQEAVVAESWLSAQETFLESKELGSSVDEVEQLIRRHEAFRKAAAAWEERISSLRRLTTCQSATGQTTIVEKLKAEQSKLPPTPLLGRKVFLDPQESSPARSSPSSLHKQTIYEHGDLWAERNHPHPSPPSPSLRLSSPVAPYSPVMDRSATLRVPEVRHVRVLGVAAGLGMASEPKTTLTKPAQDIVRPLVDVNVMAEVVLQEPGRARNVTEQQVQQHHPPQKDSRIERQLSNEQLIQARRDELPQEVWRERAEREKRLERQTSSEQEIYDPRRRDRQRLERQESSEHDTGRDQSDRRSGGGEKRSTLADIVEQLQEREAAQARGEIPRVPNGVQDKSSRPDRPRARDRPKPRRRPRPRDGAQGETRRSLSAPAQSGPSAPQPPSHQAQREGFLFRKLDIESQKKSSNRSWVNLYCVLNKGELGFYKDSKNTASTYNNEPRLVLSSCSCDINLGYKKKKNVFTLKTKDGSEYLFHAKDEDDLKGWISSISTSITEHDDISKYGQSHPTTSSTDEGTRREGSRAEKSDRASVRSDKGEKMEKKSSKKK
ncbi:spectrin beta chain, non-erythrocytic 4-like isoform X1 [Trichomycterus rosablanca]|uniref:spectrin beta chain, non-erythrocytic 4-like isoform X1 n=1 Tax=Trichomycterus rosablanca TaxID=2290929 RepID=UPI002F359044